MAMLLRSFHRPTRVLPNHGPTSARRRVNTGPASDWCVTWLSMRRVGEGDKLQNRVPPGEKATLRVTPRAHL